MVWLYLSFGCSLVVVVVISGVISRAAYGRGLETGFKRGTQAAGLTKRNLRRLVRLAG
jgi:hypothetical protein